MKKILHKLKNINYMHVDGEVYGKIMKIMVVFGSFMTEPLNGPIN